MKIKAATPKEYLDQLEPERKKALQAVRKTIKANLPKGYKEVVQYGMISYVVPLSKYPEGYLGHKDESLAYLSLGSQKNHMAIYMCNVYADKKINEWFVKAYKKSGKKLDMGKSCVRFKKLEDLPLEVIGQVVAKTSVEEFIKMYEKRK